MFLTEVMSKKREENDAWLLDAAVETRITKVNGRWEVALVFIDTKDPNHILVRKIGDYQSEKLAKIYAENMKRTAAKDIRGTQKVPKDAYDINNN